jgi:hypothetical protein
MPSCGEQKYIPGPCSINPSSGKNKSGLHQQSRFYEKVQLLHNTLTDLHKAATTTATSAGTFILALTTVAIQRLDNLLAALAGGFPATILGVVRSQSSGCHCQQGHNPNFHYLLHILVPLWGI